MEHHRLRRQKSIFNNHLSTAINHFGSNVFILRQHQKIPFKAFISPLKSKQSIPSSIGIISSLAYSITTIVFNNHMDMVEGDIVFYNNIPHKVISPVNYEILSDPFCRKAIIVQLQGGV